MKPAPRWREPLVIAACVVLALLVQRRALAGYFGLDDLVVLEEVRGLRTVVLGPWRLLSRHLFFGAALPVFGTNPVPYHLVLWVLHGANVALLFAFARGTGAGPLAAATAAALFGSTHLHGPTLESPARVGEPLALALTLVALLLHRRGVAARIAGVAAFALAMLAKESVALLPLVLLVPRSALSAGAPPVPAPGGGTSLAARARAASPLLGVAIVVALVLVASGAGTSHLGGEAYARGYGPNLFFNLMTYTRWVVDLTNPLLGQVSAIAARVWPAGLAVTLILVSLAVATWRRTALPAIGMLWWLLALVPVLPLLHHTYLYYLYVPMAGLALALGGLVEWGARAVAAPARAAPSGGPRARAARAGSPARAIAAGAVLVLLVVHAANAERLLSLRQHARMPGTGIPLDPDLRKSEMARQAALGVAKELGRRRARVAFLMPEGLRQILSTTTGARVQTTAASYPMLQGALDGGLGLRALEPGIDSVAFLTGWAPGYADFELFSQDADAHVFALGRGADGFASAGDAILRGGNPVLARDLLAQALNEFPDFARLRFHYAHALEVTGDTLGSRRQLDELIRRTPSDPLAIRVRTRLLGLPGPPGAGAKGP